MERKRQRTGKLAGVNRPTGRREALLHGRLQPRGRAGEYWGGSVAVAGVAPGPGKKKKDRRAEAVTAKRVSADGLTWFFVAMVITKRKRPETTRHLFAG